MRAVWWALAVVYLFSTASAEVSVSQSHEVVIVGGGLSGLTVLHQLRSANIDAVLVEKSATLGGRVKTVREPSGLTVNVGAELIDSSHRELINLARKLGVPIKRRTDAKRDRVYLQLDGQWRVMDDLLRLTHFHDRPMIERVWNDQSILDRLKNPILKTRRFEDLERERELDQTPLSQYLIQNRASRVFMQMAHQLVHSEFGRSLEEVSALVLFELMGVEDERLIVLPYNDESQYIEGGSDRLVRALASPHQESIFTHQDVKVIRYLSDGRYEVKINFGRADERILTAKYLVMTAPPTDNLGIRFTGFPDGRIHQDLHHSQYAQNSKLILVFNERTWSPLRVFGVDPISNAGYQIWDGTVANTVDAPATLTVLFGGIFTSNEWAEKAAQRIVAQLDAEFPGTSTAYRGFRLYQWDNSYPGPYRLGESFWQRHHANKVVNRRGRFFWAGDRWNSRSLGYMNDAVATGQRVSRAIQDEIQTERQPVFCRDLFSVSSGF